MICEDVEEGVGDEGEEYEGIDQEIKAIRENVCSLFDGQSVGLIAPKVACQSEEKWSPGKKFLRVKNMPSRYGLHVKRGSESQRKGDRYN